MSPTCGEQKEMQPAEVETKASSTKQLGAFGGERNIDEARSVGFPGNELTERAWC